MCRLDVVWEGGERVLVSARSTVVVVFRTRYERRHRLPHRVMWPPSPFPPRTGICDTGYFFRKKNVSGHLSSVHSPSMTLRYNAGMVLLNSTRLA